MSGPRVKAVAIAAVFLYESWRFVEQIANGIPMPNIPEMSAVWEMDKAVDFIVQGDDPKSVLDEITGQIAAQIQTYGH